MSNNYSDLLTTLRERIASREAGETGPQEPQRVGTEVQGHNVIDDGMIHEPIIPAYIRILVNDDGVCEFNGKTYRSRSSAVGDLAHVAAQLIQDGASDDVYLKTSDSFVFPAWVLAKYPGAVHFIYCDGCKEDESLIDRMNEWAATGGYEDLRVSHDEVSANLLWATEILITFDHTSPAGRQAFESFYRTFKDEPLLSFPTIEDWTCVQMYIVVHI